ncbi:LysR family transcriptional regulator [Aquabacter sp. L1I39]|uniref:LysR family transcriptional regulator n=1 Tax=Aquabacter sp. L1I39 TaxID=2820278 RepID=UPI001ADBBB06|nr:LysR family transcriptional regulator [Aquabacter sp. L1I39]QTL03480.1 LysR family transcriptional regulator [Aquabacter sp. L1I39]
MDLVSLRFFVETARQRSISKAAASLGVVQPALTRRIQLLEESLGSPLLMRHRRGVEPNEAGRLVLERAEVILRLVQQLETEVRFQGDEPAGPVAMGFPPSIGILFVGRILSDCTVRYPRIKLLLNENYANAVRTSLLTGQIDIGIMSSEAHHPDLVQRPLFRESMWLVGRPQDWPFPEGALSPARLDKLPLVVGSFMRTLLEKNLNRDQVRLNVVAEVDSLSLAREAVRAGAGYFVTPVSALDRELKLREFSGARLEGLEVSRGLFSHRDRPLTRAAAVLVDMIQAEAGHLCATRPDVFRPMPG